MNPHGTINGHPIHVRLASFPLGFFVATLACDWAFSKTDYIFLATAGEWLLGAGLVMAALAAIAGLIDFAGGKHIHDIRAAWFHLLGNVGVAVLETGNFTLRYHQGAQAIIPIGLIASGVAVTLLLVTGWKGWEMVHIQRTGVSESA